MRYSLLFSSLLFISLEAFAQRLPALIPYRKGQLWGYADSTGTVRIPCEYQRAELFSNGSARVDREGKAGVINSKGNEVVPFRFDPVTTSFKMINGRVFVRKNDSRDFEAWTASGRSLDKMDYYPVTDAFSEGFIPVEYESGRFGFMTEKWEPAFNGETFEMVRLGFSQGYVPVMKNSRWGYWSAEGMMFIDPTYAEAFSFEGANALVILRKEEVQVGFIPQVTGQGVNDSLPMFKEFFVFGVIDKRGALLHTLERGDAYYLSVAAVNCKMNYDKKKKAGEFKNIVAEPFYYADGTACLQDPKGQRGLIDQNANVILPCIYSDISGVSEGYLSAWKGYYATPAARCTVFTTGGKALFSNYHSVWAYHNGFAVADSLLPNGKYLNGIVDRAGKLRVPLRYPSLRETPSFGIYVIEETAVTHTPASGYIDVYGREYFTE